MRSMDIQPLRLVAATDKVAPLQRVRPADKAAEGEKDVEVSRSSLLGAKAPPASERVEAIRKAIDEGSYRIEPARIADAMIAAAEATRNSQ